MGPPERPADPALSAARGMLRKVLLAALAVLLAGGAGLYAWHRLSPWPAVLLIRQVFAHDARRASASIAHLVPGGVTARRGLAYLPDEPAAKLDLFVPERASEPLPLVVWVHGGGFVAGARGDVSNYLAVLAGRGYAVAAIGYTRAPEARFPTPVRQTHAALGWLAEHADRLGLDPTRVVLAGSSAGAQIAAQTALGVAEPGYARGLGVTPGLPREALRGVVLFCGPYDPALLDFDGAFGGFMRTVLWAYLGARDPGDPRLARLNLLPQLTARFPPAFVSVGNADPLAPQSHALAAALAGQGVTVDTLFFPPDHEPKLGHEYQLLLSTTDGRLSFERMAAFIETHAALQIGPRAPHARAAEDMSAPS